jgi:methyltransferase family protein
VRSASQNGFDLGDAPACFCGGHTYQAVLSGRWQRGGHDVVPFTVAECRVCGLARTLPVPDASRYESAESCWNGASRRDDSWSARIADDLARRAGGGRLLDVGCNTGNLVEACGRRGFDAEGIDLDPSAVAEGQRMGRSVSTTPIYELQGPYDVIVMNHVLEHVPDLRPFLERVDALLAPESGLVVIRVPYYRGLIPRLMKDRWFAWAPDEHIWHFTPDTLRLVVADASALRPVEVFTKGAIEPPSSGAKGVAKSALARAANTVGRGDQVVAVFAR